MCEVEFWEVFYGKNEVFIVVVLYYHLLTAE